MQLIHQTKYKNVRKSILIALLFFVFAFVLLYKTSGLSTLLSLVLNAIVGVFFFVLIGRKIIIRHLIGDNFQVTVEYLLRPDYKKYYSKTDVKNIVFKTIDYGRYGRFEKGIILFKNQENYHHKYLTFRLDDEPKWFWTNFKYPNKLNHKD